jgi:hypothetical protein
MFCLFVFNFPGLGSEPMIFLFPFMTSCFTAELQRPPSNLIFCHATQGANASIIRDAISQMQTSLDTTKRKDLLLKIKQKFITEDFLHKD